MTAKQRKSPVYTKPRKKRTTIVLPEAGEVKRNGPKGTNRVYWGWQEYRAIAPTVIAHLRANGRIGLTSAVLQAQQVLPIEMHRDRTSICACCAPSCKLGIVKVMEHIAGEPLLPTLQLVRKPDANPPPVSLSRETMAQLIQAVFLRVNDQTAMTALLVNATGHATLNSTPPEKWPALHAALEQELRDRRAAAASNVTALPTAGLPVSPSPVPRPAAVLPAPAPAVSAELAALLAAPVSVFLPMLRSSLQELVLSAIREPIERAVAQAVAKHEPKVPDLQALLQTLLAHERREFLQLARDSIAEVLGGPAPGTAAAVSAPQSQEQAPKPQEQAQEAAKAQAQVHVALEHVEPSAKPAKDVPHTLEDQLAHAAKVGAIPAAVRKCVVAVGLHPTTQAECERFYGHAFRFVFLRPDAFNAQRDLPASADVVLLYKKRLSEELLKATRRYNLPVRNVHNSSRAVLDVLSELFDDAPVPHEVSHEGPLQHLARTQSGSVLHS